MAKDIKNPFIIEKIRAKYAVDKSFKNLFNTYSKKLPSIPDGNQPEFWDIKNLENNKLTFSNNPMAYDRTRIVSSYINGRNIKVVNIGFGSGSLENKIYPRIVLNNIEWHAIDISKKSVNKGKKIFPTIAFKVSNILKTPYNSSLFDFVVSLEVLEHIPPHSTFKAMKELKRILKKDGILIISVPLNEGLEKLVKEGKNPNQHVRIYTPDLIKAELKLSGFDIQKETFLFAFNRYYIVKSFLCRLFKNLRQPNNIIIIAKKP